MSDLGPWSVPTCSSLDLPELPDCLSAGFPANFSKRYDRGLASRMGTGLGGLAQIGRCCASREQGTQSLVDFRKRIALNLTTDRRQIQCLTIVPWI